MEGRRALGDEGGFVEGGGEAVTVDEAVPADNGNPHAWQWEGMGEVCWWLQRWQTLDSASGGVCG